MFAGGSSSRRIAAATLSPLPSAHPVPSPGFDRSRVLLYDARVVYVQDVAMLSEYSRGRRRSNRLHSVRYLECVVLQPLMMREARGAGHSRLEKAMAGESTLRLRQRRQAPNPELETSHRTPASSLSSKPPSMHLRCSSDYTHI